MRTYPTDLTPAEYELIRPELPPLESHPCRKWDYLVILNAIFLLVRQHLTGYSRYYVLDNGIKWRAVPRDFPAWGTVYGYWRAWVRNGLWEHLNTVLREQVRVREGRNPQPSACILDSQSTKTSECACERGFDGAKKINGRKRFILTDTLGLVLKAHVTPASVKETDGGRDLLERLEGKFLDLKHVWVDQGFRSWEFSCWVLGALGWTLEVSGKSKERPGSAGFKVEPRRWVRPKPVRCCCRGQEGGAVVCVVDEV